MIKKKRVVVKVAAGFDLQKTAESSISLLMQVWDFQTVKPCPAFSFFRGRKITKCNIYSKWSPFCTLKMSSHTKLPVVLHPHVIKQQSFSDWQGTSARAPSVPFRLLQRDNRFFILQKEPAHCAIIPGCGLVAVVLLGSVGDKKYRNPQKQWKGKIKIGSLN